METAVVVNDNAIPTIMTSAQSHRNRLDETDRILKDHAKRLGQIEVKLDKLLAMVSELKFHYEALRLRNQARIDGGQCM